jgi:hypothetical protein
LVSDFQRNFVFKIESIFCPSVIQA